MSAGDKLHLIARFENASTENGARMIYDFFVKRRESSSIPYTIVKFVVTVSEPELKYRRGEIILLNCDERNISIDGGNELGEGVDFGLDDFERVVAPPI